MEHWLTFTIVAPSNITLINLLHANEQLSKSQFVKLILLCKIKKEKNEKGRLNLVVMTQFKKNPNRSSLLLKLKLLKFKLDKSIDCNLIPCTLFCSDIFCIIKSFLVRSDMDSFNFWIRAGISKNSASSIIPAVVNPSLIILPVLKKFKTILKYFGS